MKNTRLPRNIKILEKSFYFIRHGQTDWNAQHRAMGITDIALNLNGETQSQQAIRQFQNLKIKTICYSPLKRAAQTAHIINEYLNCDMTPIEELKEFNLGNFAGQTIGNWFDEWIDGRLLPGGESFNDFVVRAINGVNKSLQKEGPVLIVAHGGIYWAIQRAIEQLELPDLDNCRLAHFKAPDKFNNWQCILIDRN